MNRLARRLAAAFALVAFAFAQMAVSAYACDKDRGSLAQAQVAEQDRACPDLASPNLCERHCDYGSAVVAKTANASPAPDLAPLPYGVALVQAGTPAAHAPAKRFSRGTAPPSLTRLTPLRI